MRHLKRWGIWLAAALLLLAILTRERHAFAAVAVGWTDFERVGSVYFAPSITREARAQNLLALAEARQRVMDLYGPLRGRPTLIVSDAASMSRFSDSPTGVTFYLPNGAFSVLGPPGQNVDVMAHELAHAELFARIGYRNTAWCLPVWLDEGLAVQVDRRATHAEKVFHTRVAQGWPLTPLAALATHDRFFAGPRGVVRYHYAAARVAVAEWLRTQGTQRAVQRIDRFDCSQASRAAYDEIARRLPAR